VSGASAAHVLAVTRGDVLVVTGRLLGGVEDGWGDTALELPTGPWRDVLGDDGATVDGGAAPVARLLGSGPAIVLGR
jgi:(1->4)-alpha-D-glucan 1-alpha-D-glucosylmutase